jgi:hypothetical protein
MTTNFKKSPLAIAVLHLILFGSAQAQTTVTTPQIADGVPIILADPVSFRVTNTLSGVFGYGLWARNPGGQMNASTPNMSVQTANSNAVVAQDGGFVALGGPATPILDLTSNAFQTVVSTGANSLVQLIGKRESQCPGRFKCQQQRGHPIAGWR